MSKPEILEKIDTISSDLAEIMPVDPRDYGAKFNGVDDDAPGITEALKHGNVTVTPGSTIMIASTVQINNPQRIIDFKESTVTIADNVVAFQYGSLAITQSLLNIQIKNMFVIAGNNSSFCIGYSSYFIKFYNIRITGLKGTGIGIKIVNGFNISFDEVYINGVNVGEANISGNHVQGIIIETNTNVDLNVMGTTNITNIHWGNVLIQKVEYGVLFNNNGNTVYDTNNIDNIGFSSCDYCISTNTSKNYNLQINVIRAENCGTLFVNGGQISVKDIYCYETLYAFDNGIDGYIILSGMFYHWNPTVQNGYVIKNNSGIISFKNAVYTERTASVGQYQTTPGRILQRVSPYKTTYKVNNISSLVIDPITINIYDQQAYLDFANITGYEGSEFYIFSSNGSNFLLPNGTYQQNNLLDSIMLHCKIVNGKVFLIGEQALMSKLSVAGGTAGTNKQAIQIVEITANLTQFNFNNLGLTIIYAKAAGITLLNGNSNILNFSSLNGGSAVDLNNNPLLMIPCNDGTGKGFAIKA